VPTKISADPDAGFDAQPGDGSARRIGQQGDLPLITFNRKDYEDFSTNEGLVLLPM
jgi:hypothetical protein